MKEIHPLVFTKRTNEEKYQVRFHCSPARYQLFCERVSQDGLKIAHVFQDFMSWFIKRPKEGEVPICKVNLCDDLFECQRPILEKMIAGAYDDGIASIWLFDSRADCEAHLKMLKEKVVATLEKREEPQ